MFWLSVVFIAIAVIAAIAEGALIDWARWAFSRNADGKFSFVQRISQLICAVVFALVFGLLTFAIMFKW
jgi:hypothetical protein